MILSGLAMVVCGFQHPLRSQARQCEDSFVSTKAQRSNEDTDRAVEVGKCPSDLIGVGKVYAGRYIDSARHGLQ